MERTFLERRGVGSTFLERRGVGSTFLECTILERTVVEREVVEHDRLICLTGGRRVEERATTTGDL